MNYKETLNYLYNSLPMYQNVGKSAYKADLHNSLAIDDYLGHPHRAFKCIHIAGTNGKGSVSHMLASVFQKCGYKTGLYTSPHIFDFRERIKINGEPISETEVLTFVEQNKVWFEELHPSFFEMTVAMAFSVFKKQKVDIAIIETGLGGRLDSTNIINPLVSVVTNIGLDHTQFLGTTLEEIALEKAGIFKPEVPVVIGETQDETRSVFTEKAKALNCSIVFADQQYDVSNVESDYMHQYITVNGKPFTLDLLGAYQQKNLLTSLATLEVLKKEFKLPMAAIKSGLSSVKKITDLKGRWDIIQKEPLIICETSHNEAGMIELVRQLKQFEGKTLHIITGMVNDKEPGSILKHLPKKATYYFTKAQIARALPEERLKDIAAGFSLRGSAFKSVDSAIKQAIKRSTKEDVIIITGSIFVVADALAFFQK